MCENKTCYYCEGSGKVKKSNNPEEHDRLYDKYVDSGIFVPIEGNEKAHEEVGYKWVTCESCNGTGKK